MHSVSRLLLPLSAAVSILASTSLAAPPTLVVCAPGFPGSTAEAQPSMDRFAAAVGSASGVHGLTAIYFESESDGLARMKQADAGWAMVPLPFFLAHQKELKLTPRLQVVVGNGKATDQYQLVANSQRAHSISDLAGWELHSSVGYVPDFVRRVALAGTNPPTDLKIVMQQAILTALRRAAGDEKVAVLLNREQAEALPKLPFAKSLTTLHTSGEIPAVLLCSIGGHADVVDTTRITASLLTLGGSTAGKAALAGLRLTEFVPYNSRAVGAAASAFAGSAK